MCLSLCYQVFPFRDESRKVTGEERVSFGLKNDPRLSGTVRREVSWGQDEGEVEVGTRTVRLVRPEDRRGSCNTRTG